jgi:hypothetical protein
MAVLVWDGSGFVLFVTFGDYVYGAALYWDDCFVELRRMFRLLFLPENWRYLALYIG